MQEWDREPQRRRQFYKQVARRADELLKALALSPEDCRDPAKEWKPWALPIAIRQSLDRMAGDRGGLQP